MELATDRHPFLIVSDLHIGHPATLVANVEQLEPLFSPGLTVVFNGETFEMRRPADRADAVRHQADLKALVSAKGAKAIFVTGNHDPVASEVNHLEFSEEKILVTHGDILFHRIAP